MTRLSIIEHYVAALTGHARFEQAVDGFYATVPEAPGLIAVGLDSERCTHNLGVRLEEWILQSLARDEELPIVDAIDLNTPENRRLAAYHMRRSAEPHRKVYLDLTEFDADFDASQRTDEKRD